jgi:O-antigen/teichoic acid export membrane protein
LSKSQLKIGAIISYINIIISLVIGFITVPYIVRYLGTSEYGVYSLAGSLVGYISILDFGMHNVVVRYVAKYNAKKEIHKQANFLATVLLIYSLIDVIVIIVGIIILNNMNAIFADSLTLAEIIIAKQLFIVLLINLVISLPGAVFSAVVIAYENFIFSKLLSTIKMTVRAILVITLLYLGGKSFSMVLLDTTLNLIIILINIIYCFKTLKIRIKLYAFDIDFIKKILTYTSYVFITSIADQINWKVDSLILGILTNSTLVALSAIAMQLVAYFRTFTGAISGIFLPRATKMIALGKSNKELTDLLIRVGRYQLIIIGLLLTGFIFVGKSFITLWVGEDFLIAYKIFLILSVSLIVPSCQSIGINILEAKNMHKFRAKVYLVIAIFNIIATVILVKEYGIIGAALGTAGALFVGNWLIINWYYNYKVGLEIKRYFKEVFGKNLPWIISCNIIVYFIIRVLDFEITWFNFILQVIIISVIYIFIVTITLLTNEERRQILSIFCAKKKRGTT